MNSNQQKGPQFVRYFQPIIDALVKLGGSGRPEEVEEEIAEQLSAIEMSDAAIRVLESALQKAPNQESWLSKLVDLQVSSGKYSQAAENMQILSGFHPENLNLRHDLARTYEAFQSWGAALDEWNTLVEESNYAIPSDALDDLHALAACALKARHPEPAIHASQRALSLDSDDGLAYTYLGKAYALPYRISIISFVMA